MLERKDLGDSTADDVLKYINRTRRAAEILEENRDGSEGVDYRCFVVGSVEELKDRHERAYYHISPIDPEFSQTVQTGGVAISAVLNLYENLYQADLGGQPVPVRWDILFTKRATKGLKLLGVKVIR